MKKIINYINVLSEGKSNLKFLELNNNELKELEKSIDLYLNVITKNINLDKSTEEEIEKIVKILDTLNKKIITT